MAGPTIRQQFWTNLSFGQAVILMLMAMVAGGIAILLLGRVGGDIERDRLAALDGCYGDEGGVALTIKGRRLLYGSGQETPIEIEDSRPGLFITPATTLAAYSENGHVVLRPARITATKFLVDKDGADVTGGDAARTLYTLRKVPCR